MMRGRSESTPGSGKAPTDTNEEITMMRETKIKGRNLTIKCASPEEAAAIEKGLLREGILATLANVGFSDGMSASQRQLTGLLSGAERTTAGEIG